MSNTYSSDEDILKTPPRAITPDVVLSPAPGCSHRKGSGPTEVKRASPGSRPGAPQSITTRKIPDLPPKKVEGSLPVSIALHRVAVEVRKAVPSEGSRLRVRAGTAKKKHQP